MSLDTNYNVEAAFDGETNPNVDMSALFDGSMTGEVPDFSEVIPLSSIDTAAKRDSVVELYSAHLKSDFLLTADPEIPDSQIEQVLSSIDIDSERFGLVLWHWADNGSVGRAGKELSSPDEFFHIQYLEAVRVAHRKLIDMSATQWPAAKNVEDGDHSEAYYHRFGATVYSNRILAKSRANSYEEKKEVSRAAKQMYADILRHRIDNELNDIKPNHVSFDLMQAIAAAHENPLEELRI